MDGQCKSSMKIFKKRCATMHKFEMFRKGVEKEEKSKKREKEKEK